MKKNINIITFEKINELPTNWTSAKLDEICNVKGRVGWRGYTKNDLRENGPYVIGATHISDSHKIDISKPVFISYEKYLESPEIMVNKGDIITAQRGSIGKVALVDIDIGEATINPNVLLLKDVQINNKFLLFLLTSPDYQRIISDGITSTAVSMITQEYVKKIPILLPPLNEQKRIVTKLEELFTKLDAGIEYLKKTQILLKKYRQSVLKHAFEGKLTEKWRKQNHRKNRIYSIQNNKIFNENYFLLNENTIPENWNWYALSDIAKIGQGGTPSTNKKEYWNGEIPWIRSGEVNWNRVISSSSTISKTGLDNSAAKLLPKDTVLLAMTGEGLTRGRSAILDIECSTNQSVAFIIPDNHKVLSKFLFYYFMKEYWNIRNIKKGSNQPGLNTSLIKNFLIPLPNVDEQYEIILEIEKYLSLSQNSEKIIKSNLIQSKILRHSILKKCFEGKLVHHDPNDEPAEILLQRIKQERELPIPIIKEKSKITKRKSIVNDSKQMRLM